MTETRVPRHQDELELDHEYLAYVLKTYAIVHGLDDNGLVAYLGCTASQLDMMRWLRRPSDYPALDQISDRFNLAAGKLEALVASVNQLEALHAQHSDRRNAHYG